MAVGIKRVPGGIALYPDFNFLRAEGQQKKEAAIILLTLSIQTLLHSGLYFKHGSYPVAPRLLLLPKNSLDSQPA